MRVINTEQVIHRAGIDQIIPLFDSGAQKFYTDLLGEEITNKQAFHRLYEEGDFDYATTDEEGTGTSFDEFRLPNTMDITARKRRIGWGVSDEAQDADMYGILRKYGPKLRRSLEKTMELLVANQINNFTSTSSPYAVPGSEALISTAHAIEGGATAANRPSTDLALAWTAVAQAIQEMKNQVSWRGIPEPSMPPFRLIVPNAIEGLAWRIVNTLGPNRSMQGTANSDAGGYVTGSIVFSGSNPWLTDTNNWALQADAKMDRVICLLRRRGIVMREWFNPDKEMWCYSVGEIYAIFNKGWRKFWGTAPA